MKITYTKWPQQGVININVGGAFFQCSGTAAIGVVAPDNHRLEVGGMARKSDWIHTVEGWFNAVIEGDALGIATDGLIPGWGAPTRRSANITHQNSP
ncbi:hypothetical protein V6N11_026546 [Hibiscus sabdariffa]|uniref:Uncharacterized protein n=1 Tax=Hibiscus sabdariffa TaxID=183260 RepID=A0ABR2SWB1_9ROSI